MNRLPSNELTNDSERYCAEWRAIADKLESALDCTVIAFDPGFLLCPLEGRSTCNIPMWVARKVIGLSESTDDVVAAVESCIDVLAPKPWPKDE
jgi:hypothetical protein